MGKGLIHALSNAYHCHFLWCNVWGNEEKNKRNDRPQNEAFWKLIASGDMLITSMLEAAKPTLLHFSAIKPKGISLPISKNWYVVN